MQQTIAETMNELRTDHRNMVMLLDLLDAETRRLAGNGEPDFELIGDIMTYMTEYPDTVHHPKEDLIYLHIRSHRDDIDASLQKIKTDHRALAEASADIRRNIQAIAAESVVDRRALTADLRRYSRDLRKHMHWEEKELFELADEMQDDEGWARMLQNPILAPDPMFSGCVERRFRTLLKSIQQRMILDIQQYIS